MFRMSSIPQSNTGYEVESSADRAVAMFHAIDRKVDAMREQRINDPDSLGDKMFKFAVPALIGLAAGKLFDIAWKRGTASRRAKNGGEDTWLMGLIFAALSAAFGAVVSQLSDRGSQAFVDMRHRRRQNKKG